MRRSLQGMRLATLAAILVTALAAGPALAAEASDPLLSGYGGPGDGEQVLIGQTLLLDEGGSRGGGTGAAAVPSADALYEEASAPAADPVQQAEARPARPARRPERPAREPAVEEAQPTPAPDPAAGAAETGSAASAVGAGGPVSAPSPVDGRDVLLLGAVVLLLLALAGCARRLAVRAAHARRPPTLQPR